MYRDAAVRPARTLDVSASLVQRYLIHGKTGVQPQHVEAKQDFQKRRVREVQNRRPLCMMGVFMFFVLDCSIIRVFYPPF